MANYPKRRQRHSNRPEEKINETVSELMLFEEWRKTLAPELREMILKGTPAKEILKKYESSAAARLVTIALTDKDSAKALSAAKEIQDRVSGKATEHKKIEHQMAELSDAQLDALLKTEFAEAVDD